MKKVNSILNYLMFGSLIIYFLFFLYHSIRVIFFPYQLNLTEGLLLDQVFCILKGENFYFNRYPYHIANYTPVFPLIATVLVPIFGKTFIIGRLITTIATILISFLIFKFIKDKTNNIKTAFIGSLSFYFTWFVYYYGCIFHCETISILFSLIGLYFIYKYENSSKIYLAVLFFVLSFYTKQTRIIAPIASFIYLYFKNRKIVWKFIFLYVITITIIFLYLNKITKGEFFLHTVYSSGDNIFIKLQLFHTYYSFLHFNSIFLLFGFFYLISTLLKKEFSIFVIYFILNGIGLISTGQLGADMNHLIEFIAAGCILFGLGINEFENKIKIDIFIPLAIIIQIIVFFHIPHIRDFIITPTTKDIKAGKIFYDYVKNIKGEILSDEIGVLVLNNKKIHLNPYPFSKLSRQNKIDQQKILENIYNKKFSLVILSKEVTDKTYNWMFTKEIMDTIQKNYELVNRLEASYYGGADYFYLYKPISLKRKL